MKICAFRYILIVENQLLSLMYCFVMVCFVLIITVNMSLVVALVKGRSFAAILFWLADIGVVGVLLYCQDP